MTDVSGFEAACPSPQIEASRIAWLNWPSSSWFQTGCCIRIAAFWVPTRQGVHCPQLSSSKNFIRFSAAIPDAIGLGQDDDCGRADEAPVFLQRAEIERDVVHRGRQDAAGSPARQIGVNVCPSAIPPQNSSINSRTVTPAGASFMPGFLTRPETE